MAMVRLEVHVDVEPAREALQALHNAHAVLCAFHGARYRNLERDIERAMEDPGLIGHDLGEGHLLVAPEKPIVSLIRRARALGVI